MIKYHKLVDQDGEEFLVPAEAPRTYNGQPALNWDDEISALKRRGTQEYKDLMRRLWKELNIPVDDLSEEGEALDPVTVSDEASKD